MHSRTIFLSSVYGFAVGDPATTHRPESTGARARSLQAKMRSFTPNLPTTAATTATAAEGQQRPADDVTRRISKLLPLEIRAKKSKNLSLSLSLSLCLSLFLSLLIFVDKEKKTAVPFDLN